MSEDWDPGGYARFQDLRLRPGLDLLHTVGPLVQGEVVDLGCGSGALSAALRARASGRRLIGVDTSQAMSTKALETGNYDEVQVADAAHWSASRPMTLVFSNAALHWLEGHERLMPRLTSLLAPGGTLAVQMPHQNKAPSHRVWVDLAEKLFPSCVERLSKPGVMAPVEYEASLAPLGQFRLWETEYYQKLSAESDSHPVRRFTESTFARPILQVLDSDQRKELVLRYEEVMHAVYPLRDDGSVLFPFRRLFFTLTV